MYMSLTHSLLRRRRAASRSVKKRKENEIVRTLGRNRDTGTRDSKQLKRRYCTA